MTTETNAADSEQQPAARPDAEALALRMLAASIGRYEEVSREWEMVRDLAIEDEDVETDFRRDLREHAEVSLERAELELATRMRITHDLTAPLGGRGEDFDPVRPELPAVRHRGRVYSIVYNMADLAPHIACFRVEMLLDLDARE